MKSLFDILSIFDWITPAIGIVETFAHDPTPLQSNSWTFFVPYDQSLANGWDAVGIESLLQRNGIETWGGQITNGEFFTTVKLDQAQLGESLLLKSGVPLSEKFSGAPPPKRKKHNQTPHAKAPLHHRTWTWIPCLVDSKSCRGEMTCSACNCCKDHCGCLGG